MLYERKLKCTFFISSKETRKQEELTVRIIKNPSEKYI
jgi:hypothetical protein